ncbi:MAG: HemK/PrmC family methyltransferase [Polyangiaceae bacterium]
MDEIDDEVGGTVRHTMERGRVRFMGLELLAGPGALVARRETEILGRTAIDVLRGRGRAELVIDMCCGSGNLACAIAAHVEEPEIHACDLTDGCVDLARRNVEKHGFGHRVRVHQGDLFEPLRALEALAGAVDVIVCNPPYISTQKLEKDRVELLDHEPREAFDGGPYGIAIHQRAVKDALHFLKPGGVLLFEIGAGQAKQVSILFNRARGYEEVRTVSDATGEVRVVYSTRKA